MLDAAALQMAERIAHFRPQARTDLGISDMCLTRNIRPCRCMAVFAASVADTVWVTG